MLVTTFYAYFIVLLASISTVTTRTKHIRAGGTIFSCTFLTLSPATAKLMTRCAELSAALVFTSSNVRITGLAVGNYTQFTISINDCESLGALSTNILACTRKTSFIITWNALRRVTFRNKTKTFYTSTYRIGSCAITLNQCSFTKILIRTTLAIMVRFRDTITLLGDSINIVCQVTVVTFISVAVHITALAIPLSNCSANT